MFDYFRKKPKQFQYKLGTASFEMRIHNGVLQVVLRDHAGSKRTVVDIGNAEKIRDWFLETFPRKPADVIKIRGGEQKNGEAVRMEKTLPIPRTEKDPS